MENVHATVYDLLARMPDAFAALATDSAYHGFDGVWGPFECLAHVVDVSEAAFRQRIRRILELDQPLIASIDPPALLRAGGYERLSAAELIARYREERRRDNAWLRSLPPAALTRTGLHDEAGLIRAAEIVNYWPVHELSHLRQAAGALRAGLLEGAGPMAIFAEEI